MDERLLERLEVLASRLEAVANAFDINLSTDLLPHQSVESTQDASKIEASPVSATPVGATMNSGVSISAPSGTSYKYAPISASHVTPAVTTYDAMVETQLTKFINYCAEIGGDVDALSRLVQQAFSAQREFMLKVSVCKEPPRHIVTDLLRDTSSAISAVQTFCSEHRSSDHFTHLSTISESIPALGWITVSPTPGPYVQGMKEAGEFFANRVLRESKGKDGVDKEWVRAWMDVLGELQSFIKEHHAAGLQWKKGGRDVLLPPNCGLPPPTAAGTPPPAAAAMTSAVATAPCSTPAASSSSSPCSANVAQDISSSSATQSLRFMTPRGFKPQPNPKPQAFAATQHVQSPAEPQLTAVSPDCQPHLSADGRMWLVEHQVGKQDLVVTVAKLKQSVYINKCVDCVVTVKGKPNAIVLDSCVRTGLVFDEVVSALEILNCRSVQMQVINKVLSILIQKTDGCMVYLSKASMDVDIISAKSSEMNVLVPDELTGEFQEFPLPEQFVTLWKGERFETEPVEQSG